MSYKVEVVECVGDRVVTTRFEDCEDFLSWEQANDNVSSDQVDCIEGGDVTDRELAIGMLEDVPSECLPEVILLLANMLEMVPPVCGGKGAMCDEHFLDTKDSHFQEVVDYINSLPKGTYCGV